MNPASLRRLLALGLATFVLYGINEWVENALAHPPAGVDLKHQGLLYGLYLLVTAAIFGVYGMILGMARRGELASKRPRVLAVGMACVLPLALALLRPHLSQDLLTYCAHGFLGMLGRNPMAEIATAAGITAPGAALAPAGWRGDNVLTPYGIIWTSIEIGAARMAGGHLSATLLLLKGVAVTASLLSAYLLGRLLDRVAPHKKQLGQLAYLWNPLLLIELAGEGHNDALLLLCTITALTASVYKQTTASVVAQLCGVLTKYVVVLMLPAQLVYLWRTRPGDRARFIREVLTGAVIAAGLAALLYAPLWLGLHSFDGLARQGLPQSSASPLGMINWVLRRFLPASLAGTLTVAAIGLPTLLFIAWISRGVRNATGLTRAFAGISLFYLLVTAPLYWPWYACMPVMLLLAADPRRHLWMVFLLSFLARAVAPLELLHIQGVLSMQVAKGLLTGLGTTVPLLVLLIWLALRSPPAPLSRLWRRSAPSSTVAE